VIEHQRQDFAAPGRPTTVLAMRRLEALSDKTLANARRSHRGTSGHEYLFKRSRAETIVARSTARPTLAKEVVRRQLKPSNVRLDEAVHAAARFEAKSSHHFRNRTTLCDGQSQVIVGPASTRSDAAFHILGQVGIINVETFDVTPEGRICAASRTKSESSADLAERSARSNRLGEFVVGPSAGSRHPLRITNGCSTHVVYLRARGPRRGRVG
jgi:hypothetical protein